MSHDPGHGVPHLDGLIDPETDPRATYALEPDAVAPLLARIVTSHDAGTHRAVAPFTGAPLVELPLSGEADVARAVDRARVAQADWAARPVAERAGVLLRVHDLVLSRQSEVLDLVQTECGKTRRDAFEEVADAAQVARHYGVRGAAYLGPRRVAGALPGITRTVVHRRPLGVVGVIEPWNYPLALTMGDVLPALLAGNAVVLKPDTGATLTALWVVSALAEAGLPEDVLQVVVGGGEVGAALVEEVDQVTFTGGTPVGRAVAARAGERLVPATLELGGKNPLYVAADADVPAAAAGAVRACFTSAGQLCLSVERLVLHEAVADAFLESFLPRVRSLQLSAALDYSGGMGSLAGPRQLERVEEHVHDALARGARILTGGVHRADVGPFFYAPTVLDAVPPHALCAQEETFGPVVSVVRVADDDAAVRVMNETEYGLSASIWTGDVRRGRGLAARVEAGLVSINDGYASAWGSVAAPVGGTKSSGLGRRHGRDGILAYTRAQTVAAAATPGSPAAWLSAALGLGGAPVGARARQDGAGSAGGGAAEDGTAQERLTRALSLLRRLHVG